MSRQIDSASSGSLSERYSSAFATASGIPAFEMVFSLNSIEPPLASTRFWSCCRTLFCPSYLPHQHEHGIVKFVDNTLLQRNDRIIRNVNLLGAHFRTALGDVAQTEAEVLLEHARAGFRIARMHFEPRDPDEEPRSPEMLHFLVLAEHVAHILAQEAFNAFPKFLHPVHIYLVHFPLAGAGLERRNCLVDAVIPGNVSDQVFDHRKRFHGLNRDGLVQGKRVHTGFASEPRPAIDLRRARAALAGLAIPAHRQVGRLVRLDVVERIQHDHSRGNGDAVRDGLPTLAVSPEHLKDCFRHRASTLSLFSFLCCYFSSATSCFKSSGKSGTADWRSVIALPWQAVTLFFVPQVRSRPG